MVRKSKIGEGSDANNQQADYYGKHLEARVAGVRDAVVAAEVSTQLNATRVGGPLYL